MAENIGKNSKRIIAVVTGTRAEFGLLDPVMRAIAEQPRLLLRTIVTGTHLTTGTWRDISARGYRLDVRVPMQQVGRTGRQADVQALGQGIRKMGHALVNLKPDVVLVLGDRIEVFAAAAAAQVGGYLLAHIHGGDRAEGVADESLRHATTKLAHLHFPATRDSRRRIIRMGEDPHWVFCVGSPAMDGLAALCQDQRQQPETKSASPELLAEAKQSKSNHPPTSLAGIVVMQHPIGADDTQEAIWMNQTMTAVAQFGLPMTWLAPNSDPGCPGIRQAIKRWQARRAPVQFIEHLPRGEFLKLLKKSAAIVGNSSAGLIEAAALRVPCINVGPRQNGRLKPANVIDCDYGASAVETSLRRALKLNLARLRHPYGDGRTGRRIADLLATLDLSAIPLRKQNQY